MKKSDFALLILLVSVIGVAVYFAGNAFFSQQTKKPAQVEVATPILTDVKSPSDKIFNDNSVNPTVPIEIGSGQPAQ